MWWLKKPSKGESNTTWHRTEGCKLPSQTNDPKSWGHPRYLWRAWAGRGSCYVTKQTFRWLTSNILNCQKPLRFCLSNMDKRLVQKWVPPTNQTVFVHSGVSVKIEQVTFSNTQLKLTSRAARSMFLPVRACSSWTCFSATVKYKAAWKTGASGHWFSVKTAKVPMRYKSSSNC